LPNLLAERRLGDVEALGRPAEVQLLGDRDEVPEVSELHPLRYADDINIRAKLYWTYRCACRNLPHAGHERRRTAASGRRGRHPRIRSGVIDVRERARVLRGARVRRPQGLRQTA